MVLMNHCNGIKKNSGDADNFILRYMKHNTEIWKLVI